MPGFTWRRAGDVPWYRLWVSRNGEVYADRWLTDTNWTFAAELPYGSYQWWVNTWKDGVRGPWAGPAEFAIGAAVPQQPAGLQPGPPTELRWSDAGCPDAAWYEVRIDWGTRTFWQAWIRRDQTAALPGAMRAFDDLPAFIPPFGAYTWRIRAWHATGGMGPWSQGLAFSVP